MTHYHKTYRKIHHKIKVRKKQEKALKFESKFRTFRLKRRPKLKFKGKLSVDLITPSQIKVVFKG